LTTISSSLLFLYRSGISHVKAHTLKECILISFTLWSRRVLPAAIPFAVSHT